MDSSTPASDPWHEYRRQASQIRRNNVAITHMFSLNLFLLMRVHLRSTKSRGGLRVMVFIDLREYATAKNGAADDVCRERADGLSLAKYNQTDRTESRFAGIL